MNSTVTAVESFRFLGTTISQDLKWDNHIDSIAKNAQQRLYFLCQLRKFNLPQELLIQFYSSFIESVLCSSITVWFGSATKTDMRRQSGLLRGLSVPLCPASKNFTPPEWGKGLRKSLWTPHTQLTLSLNYCPLAGATDHWAPKQPDTRTFFSPRLYPTWITHNTPRYCTSVNNSSNFHLYIGHMHIHSSVYGHFYVLYIVILLLLLFIIIVYSLHY